MILDIMYSPLRIQLDLHTKYLLALFWQKRRWKDRYTIGIAIAVMGLVELYGRQIGRSYIKEVDQFKGLDPGVRRAKRSCEYSVIGPMAKIIRLVLLKKYGSIMEETLHLLVVDAISRLSIITGYTEDDDLELDMENVEVSPEAAIVLDLLEPDEIPSLIDGLITEAYDIIFDESISVPPIAQQETVYLGEGQFIIESVCRAKLDILAADIYEMTPSVILDLLINDWWISQERFENIILFVPDYTED